MRIARLAMPALLASGAFAAPAETAALLIPHRAVYDLKLDDASERSGITGIAGRMVYEFNGSACDGYTVTFRFVTQIDTAESSRLTDQQTTTYEAGDGKTFSFVTRSYVDQALDQELKGTAKLEGGSTEVSLTKPEDQDISLEATQFPTQHLIELLAKADKGETFYETTLFDGSEDGDKVMTTTVIIGDEAAAKPADPEFKALDDLDSDLYWPVDIAYFDLAADEPDGEEMPTYRISFKLHESGVTRDLVMDYGDFSMSGRLVDLAVFDEPKACTD